MACLFPKLLQPRNKSYSRAQSQRNSIVWPISSFLHSGFRYLNQMHLNWLAFVNRSPGLATDLRYIRFTNKCLSLERKGNRSQPLKSSDSFELIFKLSAVCVNLAEAVHVIGMITNSF